MADTQWNIDDLLETAVMYMRDVGMPNEADAIIELQSRNARLRALSQPAVAVLPTEIEEILACLGDDIDTMRSDNEECEIAANMQRAHDLIFNMANQPAAPVAQVPIEWRRVVHDLMSLTGFSPLCQKNVMDECRCYDCVMERAGALVDAQSALAAAQSAKGGV